MVNYPYNDILKAENERFSLIIRRKGASVVSLSFKEGESEGYIKNTQLLGGYCDESDWKEDRDYVNAVVGPLAGRYIINGNVLLHGGEKGYSKKDFDLELNNQGNSIKCSLYDQDSNTYFTCKYTLFKEGLEILLTAVPEEPLHLNLTSHLYITCGSGINDDLRVTADFEKIGVKKDNIITGYSELNEHEKKEYKSGKKMAGVLQDDFFKFFENENKERKIKIDGKKTISLSCDSEGVVIYTRDFPGNNSDLRAGIAVEAQEAPGITNFDEDSARIYTKTNPFIRKIILRVND